MVLTEADHAEMDSHQLDDRCSTRRRSSAQLSAGYAGSPLLQSDGWPVRKRFSIQSTIQHGECMSLLSVDSVVRDERSESLEGGEDKRDKAIKRHHLRNLVLLILGMCFNYTPYLALQSLQSSLNSSGGAGVLGLAANFCGNIFSSLFLGPFLIRRFGERKVLYLTSLGYANLIAANAVAMRTYLVLAFSVVGVLSGATFPAQLKYIGSIAEGYSKASHEPVGDVVIRFNGAFFSCFVTTHIFGNLFSSLILAPKRIDSTVGPANTSLLHNATNSLSFISNYTDFQLPTPLSNSSVANMTMANMTTALSLPWYYGDCRIPHGGDGFAVDAKSRLILMATFGGFVMLGLVFLLSLRTLPPPRKDNLLLVEDKPTKMAPHPQPPLEDSYSKWDKVRLESHALDDTLNDVSVKTKAESVDNIKVVIGPSLRKRFFSLPLFDTLRLVGDVRLQRLMPLMLTVGLVKAFIYGDYTKFFVAQCLGTSKIGFGMACFGAMNALANVVLVKVAMRFGRRVIVASAVALSMATLIFCLTWHKVPEPSILYAVSGVWGLVDAVWNPQISAILGGLFRDSPERAFANYCLFCSLGFLISFGIGTICLTYTGVFIKIGILLVALPVSFFFYYQAEGDFAARQATQLDVDCSSEELT